MKKTIIILLCLALLGGGGYFGYRKYEQNRDEKKVVDVVPVSMMAEPADMFMYTGSDTWGYISAANEQKVYVDTDKLVQKVCVKQGQKVKKGDTILEYDMTIVDLELTQKENQVQVIEQDIKMAQKELARIRTLLPSEDMPLPIEPELPEEPIEPELPEEIIVTVPELTGVLQPASGTGSPDDPMVFNCGKDTVVRKAFMTALAGAKRTAALRVYDEEACFLYQWLIAGDQIKLMETEDWVVTDGISIDPETGGIAINPGGVLHGQLSFAVPETDIPEDDEMLEPEFPEMEFDVPEIPDYGSNYLYSRKELQRMVTDQENQIKTLELDLKSAKLAFETAKKQKSDGKVVAAIDGIVKKIGKSADEANAELEQEPDTLEQFEKEMYEEPSADDNAFAVIVGAGGVEVICEVPEMMLKKLPIGTVLTVQSYQNGAMTEAKVTSVEDEPYAYSSDPWSANPNSSIYKLHATLADSTEFTIGNGVNVLLPQDQNAAAKSKSYYLPIHYVRQEAGDYYVMKADENDRLTKQYVSVGQTMYGYYIEVTGGLDVKNDRICFPFGTDVKEGVRTQESTEVLYPTEY